MIIALEIGAALSAIAMMVLYVSNLPKPKRVRIRVQDQRARRP